MAQFISLKPRQNNDYTHRLSLFLYFCYFIIFVIIFRFFQLQILMGDEYYQKSLGNTEQKYPLIPPRGLIFDRNGIIMAKNKAAYNLNIIPAYLPKKSKERLVVLKKIAADFNIPLEMIQTKLSRKYNSYEAILIKENISKKEVLFLEEHRNKFPFLNIIAYSARIYPFGESASHILGYTGMISPRELKQKEYRSFRQDSIIGKTGIERQYDNLLRGIQGESVKIVNSVGKPLREIPEKNLPAVPGKNVVLSIDSNLQDFAYHMLYKRRGAIIVTRPVNGEVIAFVSSPGYDANLFVNPLTREQAFPKLLKDPEEPFLNRAIQGKYSPGSAFKIVTAIAGLEDERVDNDERVQCRGSYTLGDRVFRDLKVHGSMNLVSAIEESCNVFFYTLGYRLGYASILEYARNLGLNDPTGIDLPTEHSGRIPTPEWKEKNFKEPWYDGDTINASIGQGYISTTPLGANNIPSLISANAVYQPRILWKIRNPYTGFVEKEFPPQLLTKMSLKQHTLDIIREGMRRAPLSGTATYHKYLSKVPIAGKTGSAQNVQKKTHSWFVSYGPLDKALAEQYAVTVMVESSGHGGSIAVPIASMVFNYLAGNIDRENALKTIYQIFEHQERQ